MEEILASIRRIIADDEAKPVVAEAAPPPPKPAPPSKPVAMTDIPPSAIPAAQAAAAKASPPPAPKPPLPPEPAASNSQDDIDAMLASLEAATTEEEVRPAQPDGDVFELTDDMVVPEPAFQHVEPEDDLEFAEAVAASAPMAPRFDPPSYDAPSAAPQQQILSHSTVSSV